MSNFNFKLQLQQKGLRNPAEAMMKAQRDALNRVGDGARTFATRNITENFGVAYSKTLSQIKQKKATQNSLVYEMTASGKRIALKYFKPQKGATGATVEVRRGRREIKQGAFIVKSLSNNVWKRTGIFSVPAKGIYAGKNIKREQIQRQYGPSVPMMFSTTKLRELLNRFVAEKMPKELAGKLQFYMQFVK